MKRGKQCVLRLSEEHYEEMVEHCMRALPREGCGILGGIDNRVLEVHCLENIADSSSRYLIAPEEQLATLSQLEEHDLELVGIFHSHPMGHAYPSLLDIEQAYYPDSVYVIIGLRNRRQPSVRAFRIVEGAVTRVRMILE